MSRSYRKNAIFKQKNDSYYKKLANRAVRNKPVDYDIPDGKAYKKLMCSWDICDFRFYEARNFHNYREKMRQGRYMFGYYFKSMSDKEILKNWLEFKRK